MSDQATDPPRDTVRDGVRDGTADGVVPDPRTGRRPGLLQVAVLMLSSCLSILGAVLIAPVLPSMQAAFADVAGAAALVPLVLTAPALVIGLLAPVAGRIVDTLGRKNLLVGAMVLYAVVGTAPLWLDSLPMILVSRIGVGLAEAAIMTCATTLIADYFTGHTRDKYLGLQVVFTTIAATICFALGGALGATSWRTPFWLYLVSLPLAVMAAVAIWEPVRRAKDEAARALPPVPWRQLLGPVVVSLFGGIAFYTLVVELSYALTAVGVTSVGTIGLISAVASAATAVGALTFPRVAHRGPATLLPVAFAAIGIGLAVVAAGSTVVVVLIGAVIAGYGQGLLLPSLLTWTISSLSLEQRGRGTGLWTAAVFLGEFICPLVVLALTAALSGLSAALLAVGIASLVVAVVVRIVRPTRHVTAC
jgi:MFS family permease